MKFSQELAEDSPCRAQEFVAGKDAVTLARDILALDRNAFRTAFRKSPMQRAKLVGLRRNAGAVLADVEEGLRRRRVSDAPRVHDGRRGGPLFRARKE